MLMSPSSIGVKTIFDSLFIPVFRPGSNILRYDIVFHLGLKSVYTISSRMSYRPTRGKQDMDFHSGINVQESRPSDSLVNESWRSHGNKSWRGNRSHLSKSNFYNDSRRKVDRRINENGDLKIQHRPIQNSAERTRQRHPPGLKGRDIGLWYASRNKNSNETDLKNAPNLSMGVKEVRDLNEALNNLKDEGPSVSAFSNAAKRSQFLSSECEDEYDSQMLIDEDSIEDQSKLTKKYIDNARQFRLRNMPLRRYHSRDIELYDELIQNMDSPGYKKMLKLRKNLPSYNMRKEIIETISANQVVVLSGETGCGKTTQVGQFILDDWILNKNGSVCHIVCTQPRRLSTIAVSQRVAEERNEELGESVGFKIRLEENYPRADGSILFCTTGIVLQWLISDPMLSAASHVILDEIHERDTDSDFLMCVIKELMMLRPDLKVILMSATLNAEKFSKYFGNCSMLHIPGFTYDVEEYFLEDVLKFTNFKFTDQQWRIDRRELQEFYSVSEPYIRELSKKNIYPSSVLQQLSLPQSEQLNMNLIVDLLKFISKQPSGAVLVFVPGWDSISKLDKLIKADTNFANFIVYPLHSLMPTKNQREIFDKPPVGFRKVILATSIAETSITINDIVYVIDGGKIKMKNYDKESHISTLAPQWVTMANAKQRRGRAGRVQDGVCYHLYSRGREMHLEDFPLPEMQRTRLEEVILKIKILKLGSCKDFLTKLMDAPDEAVIDVSLKMLRSINAIDSDENLTPLGVHLARLPMDPLIGKMLLMSTIFSCVDPILTVAATLAFKDPFVISLGQEKEVDMKRRKLSEGLQSDHLMLANVYSGWQRAKRDNRDHQFIKQNHLSSAVLMQIQNMRKQLLSLLYDNNFVDTKDPFHNSINRNSGNSNLVKAVITAGLYPNVARILKKTHGKNQGDVRTILLSDKLHAHLHPKSVNEKERHFQEDWLVYWEKMRTCQMYLFDSTAVSAYPLLLFGQNFNFNRREKIVYVDDFVRCSCSPEVAQVMEKLRNQLNELLEYRIANPRTNYGNSTKENDFMAIVVEILNENKKSKFSRW